MEMALSEAELGLILGNAGLSNDPVNICRVEGEALMVGVGDQKETWKEGK